MIYVLLRLADNGTYSMPKLEEFDLFESLFGDQPWVTLKFIRSDRIYFMFDTDTSKSELMKVLDADNAYNKLAGVDVYDFAMYRSPAEVNRMFFDVDGLELHKHNPEIMGSSLGSYLVDEGFFGR